MCVLVISSCLVETTSLAAAPSPLLTDTSYGPIRIGLTESALRKTGLTRKRSNYVCSLDPAKTKWTFYRLASSVDNIAFVKKGKVVGFDLSKNWSSSNGLSNNSTLRDVLTTYAGRAQLQEYNEVFNSTEVTVTGGPTYTGTDDTIDAPGIDAGLGELPYCE
jgi:hypothetical protein